MLAGAAGVSAALVASSPAAAAVPGRRILLVGANPGVSLFEGDQLSTFASVWVARWSERGSGRAIVLWHGGTDQVFGGQLDAQHLAEGSRHRVAGPPVVCTACPAPPSMLSTRPASRTA
jgi:hypothetical protein